MAVKVSAIAGAFAMVAFLLAPLYRLSALLDALFPAQWARDEFDFWAEA